jgi:cyclophilin family peptidyl-prolyl cis-trans isomerase
MWISFLSRIHVVMLFVAVTVLISYAPAGATIVRYHFTEDSTDYGSVDVRMFDSAMLNTVMNFKNYLIDNDWDGTFIHRSVPGFVVQGGGFSIPATGIIGDPNGNPFLDIIPIDTDDPINDEPGGGIAGPSNLRGTIAMAKSGPDTVTSQWFFNVGNNSSLDNPARPDGGFSAFGRVLGNGMNLIDTINSLGRINVGVSPVKEVPVFDLSVVQSQGNVFNKDVVIVSDIEQLNLPAGDYDFDADVDGADFLVWQRTFGSTTLAEADGNGNVVIDLADLAIWQDTYGTVASSSAIASIPEPSTLGMALLGGFLLLKRKRCQLRMVRA